MKQLILKAVLCLSFFFLIASESLIAATSLDSASDINPSSLSLQKKSSMAALEWIQHLEDERDKADIDGNYAGFKKLTDEISATIAGKYGISERSATQEEQIVIIHSITRTRHRFMGQRNMLHDRYLGYDRAKTNSLLQTDSLFKDHMAAVLAIDAMVMKAMNDEGFEELWRQENAANTVSGDFVSGVIDHAKSHEKKESFEPLQPHFQRFLQSRYDVIHLANDVFSVFAPKMTLVKIYQEVMVSGDNTYKGWTAHNTGAFRSLATLTEEEKLLHPGLESEIRSEVGEALSVPNSSGEEVYSSSARTAPQSDEIRTRFDLNPDEMVVEYIYDDCLLERGFGVIGSGIRRFYLSRPVKPHLTRILERRHGVIPDAMMLETYRCKIMGNGAPNMVRAAQRGIPSGLNNYAIRLFYGLDGITRDIPKAIQLFRESINLGCDIARSNLPGILHNYAVYLFYGLDGITRDIPKAIEVCREAAGLGEVEAIREFPIMISRYALLLFFGTDGVEKDIPKAIDLCGLFRESTRLGEKATRILPIETMVQVALRAVVRESLLYVAANHGFSDLHHFYVSFATDHPLVQLPDYLREQYPDEMTIVLQNEYWDLEVDETRFAVTLCFDGINERLVIPFESIFCFYDPPVNFGLQLKPICLLFV